VLAAKWIREDPLREMINDSIKYNSDKGNTVDVNEIILNLIKDLNSEIRFHYVKIVKCFCDLLQFEIQRRGISELQLKYSDFGLPNYLELGMFQRGTIELHNLGLSRTSAIVVNDYCRKKGVSSEDAIKWLRDRLESVATDLARPCRAELLKFLG
jgi:hypothetical protein